MDIEDINKEQVLLRMVFEKNEVIKQMGVELEKVMKELMEIQEKNKVTDEKEKENI